jgi:L-seryl-tRNA(Ser) seleniumtransferase
MPEMERLLRGLPSVDSLLKSKEGELWLSEYPRVLVLRVIRENLDRVREEIKKGSLTNIPNLRTHLVSLITEGLQKASKFSLRQVINATGIVIHTNLGRSVLSIKAIVNLLNVARSYSNLEYDLKEGKRGKRYVHVVGLLKEITGAEDAFVVNNNAGAVFITLNSLAFGKEVIVSRGELVEIGGSFRMPDVMKMSGAILREIGTTNKTHLYDYEKAINENTGLIMKVHRSNFRISGFVEEVSSQELVALGKKHNIPVVFDLGSGCLIDLKKYGIPDEPTVQEVLKTGVDIVTFSGDKLLGGPQAGIILGRKEYIERLRRSPLARVLRVDKFTLSGLEATLYEYLDEEGAIEAIPTLRMLLEPPDKIKKRAQEISRRLKKEIGGEELSSKALINIEEDFSQAGGGSLPEINLKTYCVAIKPLRMTCNQLEERLRLADPPVIARLKEDRLLLDARTIMDEDIGSLVQALAGVL